MDRYKSRKVEIYKCRYLNRLPIKKVRTWAGKQVDC